MKGFNEKHTFYTLCESCVEDILQDIIDELTLGKGLERIRHKSAGELLTKNEKEE